MALTGTDKQRSYRERYPEKYEEFKRIQRDCQRERRAVNPEAESRKNRERNLRSKYGISIEEYDLLREGQESRCAICHRHEDELPKVTTGRPRLDGTRAEPFRLVVDHCHKSGEVRSLLCPQCNALIGQAKESTKTLQSAISYLRMYGVDWA